MFLKKKKKSNIPEPPGYGPDELGLELPSERGKISTQVPEMVEHSPNQESEKRFPDVFRHSPEKPIFIRVQNFKEIVENMISIEKKLNELENIIAKLNDIKQTEDEKIITWQKEIQDIKTKLSILEKNFSSKL